MPIVLAIEPDRRQAAHLTAIVRQQVGAELVLADTTEGALDAIGNRVPDLVLVPALLSPQDDAALAGALRVIAAAAHVRTLTIPKLANGTKRAPAAGMLAKWRRSRVATPEADGCDPAVFGEQISTYLHEAAAERAELAGDPLEDEPIEVSRPLQTVTTLRLHTPTPHADADALPAPIEQPWTESIEPLAAEPRQPWVADAVDSPLIDLSDEVAGLSDQTDDELFDGEPVGVYTISAEAAEPEVAEPEVAEPEVAEPVVAELEVAALEVAELEVDAFDLLPAILEPREVSVDAIALVAAAEPEELFVDPPEPPRADIEPWVPMYLTPGRLWPALEGMPAETPALRTEQPDWIELVASLRQDLERRRTDPPAVPADAIAARSSGGGEADTPRFAKKQKALAKKAKPVQDEWGFFDPEQCGFATLLAKLEEITEEGIGG